MQAFKLMRKRRVGGIPVVDNSGKKAVGNISIRDIQFLLTSPKIYHDYRLVTVSFIFTCFQLPNGIAFSFYIQTLLFIR